VQRAPERPPSPGRSAVLAERGGPGAGVSRSRRVRGGRLAGALRGNVLAVARSIDVDADGVHGQPIENGGGDGGVAEGAAPLTQVDIGSDRNREPAVPAIDEVEEGMGGGGLIVALAYLAQADVVQLCGAPHNSTHVERLLMWSRRSGARA